MEKKSKYNEAALLLRRHGIPFSIPEHGVIHVRLEILGADQLIDLLVVEDIIMEGGAAVSRGKRQIDFIFPMTKQNRLNERAMRVVAEAIVGDYAGDLGMRYGKIHTHHLEVSAKRSPFNGTMLGSNVGRINKARAEHGSKQHTIWVYVVASHKSVYTISGEDFYHAIDTGAAKIYPHQGKNIWMLPLHHFKKQFDISEPELKELIKLHDVLRDKDPNQGKIGFDED